MEQTISSFANLAPTFAIILGAIGLLIALGIYKFVANRMVGHLAILWLFYLYNHFPLS